MSRRPAWAISEASARCQVSRSTLKRRLSAGELPNAYKTPAGQWRIPVNDLIAAGYSPGVQPPDSDAEPDMRQPAPAPDPSGRVEELERLLSQEKLRRAAAEQIAEERRGRIEDLQLAMRLIERPRPAPGHTGSEGWSNDPGQSTLAGIHALDQTASPQGTGGSNSPAGEPSGLDQDGQQVPRQKRAWWRRLLDG